MPPLSTSTKLQIFFLLGVRPRKLPNSREEISDRVTRDGDNETKYEEWGGGKKLHEYSSRRVPLRKTIRERFVSSKKFGKRRKESYRITFEPKCTGIWESTIRTNSVNWQRAGSDVRDGQRRILFL